MTFSLPALLVYEPATRISTTGSVVWAFAGRMASKLMTLLRFIASWILHQLAGPTITDPQKSLLLRFTGEEEFTAVDPGRADYVLTQIDTWSPGACGNPVLRAMVRRSLGLDRPAAQPDRLSYYYNIDPGLIADFLLTYADLGELGTIGYHHQIYVFKLRAQWHMELNSLLEGLPIRAVVRRELGLSYTKDVIEIASKLGMNLHGLTDEQAPAVLQSVLDCTGHEDPYARDYLLGRGSKHPGTPTQRRREADLRAMRRVLRSH